MKTRHGRRDDGVAQRRFADQHVIGRIAPVAAIDAETGRGVALRIEIDDQDVFADGGERRAEIDGRRGLADAALLIGDGEYPGRLCRLRCAIGRGKANHA